MHGTYYDGRGLNKSLLKDLFRCQYIGCHQSVVLQGPTGSGKTYLACALAKQTCLGQIKARYIRLPDLLMEYGDASVVQGKQKRLLASYSKIPLLVIDSGWYRICPTVNCIFSLNCLSAGLIPPQRFSVPSIVRKIG